MAVNLLMSTHTWTQPLNAAGLRQHVLALYEEVFRGQDVRVFPNRPRRTLALEVAQHLPHVLAGDLNVLAPDYPIVTGAVASFLKRDPRLIVHTWKVPGFSDPRPTARIYDVMLRRAIARARAAVVVNLAQKRQLENVGVRCPVLFAPVSVDATFWRSDAEDIDGVVSRFGLEVGSYLLTVGGSDRDELYTAYLARSLDRQYVRATYDPDVAARARAQLEAAGLASRCRVLLNPSYEELRALYTKSWLLCLPTMTSTNPAGITSMVEGMACAAAVAVPGVIGEGYLLDGVTGLVLGSSRADFGARLQSLGSELRNIGRRAADSVRLDLGNGAIASRLRAALHDAGAI